MIAELAVIGAIFQTLNGSFLSPGNLTNLLVQGAVFMLLGMGEVFALLLGEIDLSLGYVSGIGAVVAATLVSGPRQWPWWAAVLAALAATTAIGALQGTLITRLRLPSFVVTLAGLLAWQGLMTSMLGGGTILIPGSVIDDLAYGTMTPAAAWLVLAVLLAAFAAMTLRRDAGRQGGPTGRFRVPALGKIAAATAAGIAIVAICNANRGGRMPVRGVPWAVAIVLGVLTAWTFLLNRTRFGRDVYAIGSNFEAARRAGVRLAGTRTAAFSLAGLTAGIAGIVYASGLRSVSASWNGETLVLFAVAAAVIGGTSLFGGRGQVLHGVLGGIVIAAIYNGIYLLGKSTAAQDVITALVLLAAVSVDALQRRARAGRLRQPVRSARSRPCPRRRSPGGRPARPAPRGPPAATRRR